MKPSLVRGLEVFSAVIESGSTTGAARALGISQPAISQHVLKLEAELGLALFVRQNGRMRPTETALLIHQEAGYAFEGLDRVVNLARDLRNMSSGYLRIAAPHSAALGLLPRALKILSEGHPRLRISVMLGTYDLVGSLVAGHQADLGLAKMPLISPDLEAIRILRSPIVAAMSLGNPLAAKRRLKIEHLAGEPLVMIGRSQPWREEINVAFRRARIAPRVSVETVSVASACSFAAEGFGIALVPEWLAISTPGTGLHFSGLDLTIEHEFVVVYQPRVGQRELAEKFADACSRVGHEMKGGRARKIRSAAPGTRECTVHFGRSDEQPDLTGPD